MAGNVFEWTRSLYKNYPYDPEDGRENLEAKDKRVLRGGSFSYNRRFVRCADRDRYSPGDVRDWYSGFRVVLSLF